MVDPARTSKKSGCNPLTIYFFNQNNIILIYKKIGVFQYDPVTRSKPVTRLKARVNYRTGFKNNGYFIKIRRGRRRRRRRRRV